MKIHTIQLNIGDLLGGTNSMDAAEFGAYVSLFICCYQDSSHEIPKEDSRLYLMAKCSPKTWARVKAKVIPKFIPTETGYTHERVLKDAAKYKTKSAVNSANALKRWESEMRNAMPPQSERNAIHNPLPNTQESKPYLPSVTAGREGGVLKNGDGKAGGDIQAVLSEAGTAAARRMAPGWDIYGLMKIYNGGITARGGLPDNPDVAFARWCLKYTKGKKP